ncbi:MAG: hypothetical protein NVSMB53_03460 [Gemmatimonadaceae bacterium]
MLPAYLTEPSGVGDPFLREARTAAKRAHPNIVPVYRADEKDGVVFFVMRPVNGESLVERLASPGPLAPLDAARMMQQVALALDYAHSRGVIHRDVKPEKILLERRSDSAVVTPQPNVITPPPMAGQQRPVRFPGGPRVPLSGSARPVRDSITAVGRDSGAAMVLRSIPGRESAGGERL